MPAPPRRDADRPAARPLRTVRITDARRFGGGRDQAERPGSGDDSRGWGPPFVGSDDSNERESAYFLSINRSKRLIILDLKDPDDVDQLRELIAAADVLTENSRSGVMERLGLPPERLEGLSPRLIVLSISGFGESGPDGHRAGFDQILQGEGGLMGMTGPVGGSPTRSGVPITDILSGMFGAYGVVAALHERDQAGRGQRVTTSLLASAVAVHVFQGAWWTLAGEVAEPLGNRHATIAPYGAFTCSDGWVNIAMGAESQWRSFAELVGIDPEDVRYATNRERRQNVDELEPRSTPISDRTRSRPGPYGCMKLACLPDASGNSTRSTGGSRCATSGWLAACPTPRRNIELPGAPIRWLRSGRRAPQDPPSLGEHNDEILGRRD